MENFPNLSTAITALEHAASEGYSAISDELKSALIPWGVQELPREPGYFRVRFSQPAGWNVESLQRWIEAYEASAPNHVWATPQQTIEFNGIHLDRLVAFLKTLEQAGLSTKNTLGKGIRPLITSPLAGCDPYELFDPQAFTESLQAALAPFSDWSLPVSIALESSSRLLSWPKLKTLAFVGAVREREDNKIGFDLWVGGSADREGQSLGVFVQEQEFAAVIKAVFDLWSSFQDKTERPQATLSDLLAEYGAAEIRRALEHLLERPLSLAAEAMETNLPASADSLGVYALKEEFRFAVGVPLCGGTLTLEQIKRLLDVARRHGQPPCLRLSAQQEVVILNISEASVEHVLAGLQKDGLSVNVHSFRRGYLAATSAQDTTNRVEVRNRGLSILEQLETRVHWEGPFSLHVDDGQQGDAMALFADLGLVATRIREEGRTVDAFDIWVAGSSKGKTVLGMQIHSGCAAHECARRLEQLFQTYKLKSKKGENWPDWCRRCGEEKLRGFLLADPEHPIDVDLNSQAAGAQSQA